MHPAKGAPEVANSHSGAAFEHLDGHGGTQPAAQMYCAELALAHLRASRGVRMRDKDDEDEVDRWTYLARTAATHMTRGRGEQQL